MDIKILGNLLQVTIDREKPSQPCYSKEDYGQSWSSQEWKSEAAEHDRSRKLENFFWDSLQKIDPHREEPLLGRNAHPARYGEMIHDRTGKPKTVDHQNFVMGGDAAEFCGQSQRPSVNSTEKNLKRCRVR